MTKSMSSTLDKDMETLKTFKQWAESKKLPLNFPELKENTKRAGIAHWAYPSAVVRAQYPDGYFTPIAADAVQKMSKKPNDKAPA